MNFRYCFQVSWSFRRTLAHIIVLTILLVLMQLHVSPLVTDFSSSLALQIFFSETAKPASATMYNLLCIWIIESLNLYLCKNSQSMPQGSTGHALHMPICCTRTNTSILTYMSPKQIVFWRGKAQARSASRYRCRCGLS